MSENLIEVAQAFEVIKKAMKEDSPSEGGSYAHSWHCNIAMMCYDAIRSADITAYDYDSGIMSHEDALIVGNEAASRFMKLCFDVETKQ